MKKKQENFAFIDSQNLNLGVRSQGWILDFARFRVYLKEMYHVEEAYLFIGFIDGNQMLYTYLQKAGYVCIFKPTVITTENKKIKIKGNVDAELVLHSMIEYLNYDRAIIVSGDGDFRCLIEYLDKKDKLFKIIVPNKKYSSLLREFSRYIVNIDLLKEKLKKRKE